MILTKLQKKVLLDLSKEEDWVSEKPVSQVCLNKLFCMGLIDVTISLSSEGRLIQKLTPKGTKIAKQIRRV